MRCVFCAHDTRSTPRLRTSAAHAHFQSGNPVNNKCNRRLTPKQLPSFSHAKSQSSLRLKKRAICPIFVFGIGGGGSGPEQEDGTDTTGAPLMASSSSHAGLASLFQLSQVRLLLDFMRPVGLRHHNWLEQLVSRIVCLSLFQQT